MRSYAEVQAEQRKLREENDARIQAERERRAESNRIRTAAYNAMHGTKDPLLKKIYEDRWLHG